MSPLVVVIGPRSRSDPGGCSLVNGKGAVRPLPADGGSSFLVTLLEQLECEGVGPDEELLIADAVCDQLAHKLRRQSVILQCGLCLRVAAGRGAECGRPVAGDIPGVGVDDAGTENTESDAAAVFQPEGVGETQHGVFGGNIGWQADGRRTHRMMRAGVADPGSLGILQEALTEDLATAEHAEHIDLELPAQVPLGGLKPGASGHNTRVIAENVDAAESLPGKVRQSL